MHVGIANPRWCRKRSRHSRCMRSPQYYISGKMPMGKLWDVIWETMTVISTLYLFYVYGINCLISLRHLTVFFLSRRPSHKCKDITVCNTINMRYCCVQYHKRGLLLYDRPVACWDFTFMNSVVSPRCHDMDTLSTLLALCEGNPPGNWWITLTKGAVITNCDGFFVVSLEKTFGQPFELPLRQNA